MSWFTTTSMGKFVNSLLFGLPAIIEGFSNQGKNSDGSSNSAFGVFNQQNWKNTAGDALLGSDYQNNEPLGRQLFGTNLGGLFSALTNRITAQHLTGAEREANEFNAAQAQMDRDFQERMASTQYQRGVADMRAAGVNPALAMQNGGAAAPAGVSASSAQPQGSAFDIGSLIQLLMVKPQKELMEKQGQAALLNAEAAKEQAAAATSNAGTNRARLLTIDQPLVENQIKVGSSLVTLNDARTKQIDSEIKQLAETTKLTQLHQIASALDIAWKGETWEENKRLLVSQIAKNTAATALDYALSDKAGQEYKSLLLDNNWKEIYTTYWSKPENSDRGVNIEMLRGTNLAGAGIAYIQSFGDNLDEANGGLRAGAHARGASVGRNGGSR